MPRPRQARPGRRLRRSRAALQCPTSAPWPRSRKDLTRRSGLGGRWVHRRLPAGDANGGHERRHGGPGPLRARYPSRRAPCHPQALIQRDPGGSGTGRRHARAVCGGAGPDARAEKSDPPKSAAACVFAPCTPRGARQEEEPAGAPFRHPRGQAACPWRPTRLPGAPPAWSPRAEHPAWPSAAPLCGIAAAFKHPRVLSASVRRAPPVGPCARPLQGWVPSTSSWDVMRCGRSWACRAEVPTACTASELPRRTPSSPNTSSCVAWHPGIAR